MKSELKFFALPAARALADEVVGRFGKSLEVISVEDFPDGEGEISLQGAVDGSRVIVFDSLAGEGTLSPFEKVCKLAFFLATLRSLGAAEITLIAPYLTFSRSDQRHGPGRPIYLQSMAAMLENAGLNRIVTLDVHNLAAYQNTFRFGITYHLEAARLFCEHLRSLDREGPLVVLSPDLGGIKRAERFRAVAQGVLGCEAQFSFLEKYRRSGALEGKAAAEVVRGAEVLIYDDMISTGGTISRAIEACERSGARAITVLATHGIFSQNIDAILRFSLLRQLVVTDSNAKLRNPEWRNIKKLKVLSCAPLLCQHLSESFGIRLLRAA